jgi:hypothetical protein
MFAKIAIMFAVPVMVVFAPATLAIPVAGIETAAFVARTHPMCAAIWSTSPISSMPLVVASHGIPVSIHPYKFRAWPWRENPNHSWRWWRSDFYPNRHLTERE